MDVMELRRALMMIVTGGDDVAKVATGEFDYSSGAVTITHNLGSKKCFGVFQRVNSDHSVINSTNRYTGIAIMAATVELLNLDLQQGYSLNSGNTLYLVDTGAGNTFLRSQYAYFGAADGTTLGFNQIQRPDQGLTAISDNALTLTQTMTPGRWIYTIYAI